MFGQTDAVLSGGAIDVDRAEIVEREDGGRSVLLPHFQEIACRLVCLVRYVVANLDEMWIRADAVFRSPPPYPKLSSVTLHVDDSRLTPMISRAAAVRI